MPERVAVIGAGPVGCLAALAFAQRGCKVDIYESRSDPRTNEAVARASQRSINLALSTRGITGLRSVSLKGLQPASTRINGLSETSVNGHNHHHGDSNSDRVDKYEDLADLVLQESVPMRARMIHTVTGKAREDGQANVKQDSQLYSTSGEWINSVDRGRLNNIVLDHVLRHPNVQAHFEHRLQSVDLDYDSRRSKGDSASTDRVRLDFNVKSGGHDAQSVSKYAGFVVGCDGAHSNIRSAMASLVRMNFTHEYIDSEYVELSIPPRTLIGAGTRSRGNGGVNGTAGGHDAYHLDPHHLHIWPRHSFMLIALPNLDGSFTCTLFAPVKIFAEHLSSRDSILAFFGQHFPDALPLIGPDALVDCLTSRRPSSLGSVKCAPYHYKDRTVLIGDAAHAMLPFYGQGLNCGFEDVRVLMETIDQAQNLSAALKRYTETRHPDLLAISQLAQNNYKEMAHSVVSTSYLMRKRLDTMLMAVLPTSMWKSLYSMVTFSNLPYSQVLKREHRQQLIISNALLSFAATGAGAILVGAYRSRSFWTSLLSR